MMPALLVKATELTGDRESFQSHMLNPAWHMALHSVLPRDTPSAYYGYYQPIVSFLLALKRVGPSDLASMPAF